MHKIVLALLRLFGRISGKRFVYVPKDRKLVGKTAVKTDEGFWYVGDITDTRDLAHGALYNGIVQPNESGLVKKLLQKMLGRQPSLNFFDVGAHTGYYGLMAAFLGNGTVSAYAFEPLAEFCWSLEQSANLNHLENKIKVFGVAVGDKAGIESVFLAGSGSSLHADYLGQDKPSSQPVRVETLDGLIENNHLPAPDFLRIDVAGHEYKVLSGGQRIITQHHPVIFMEMARTLKNVGRSFVNSTFEQTFDLLKSWGYKIFCLEATRLTAVTKNYQADGEHMFLCVPEKHEVLVDDFVR